MNHAAEALRHRVLEFLAIYSVMVIADDPGPLVTNYKQGDHSEPVGGKAAALRFSVVLSPIGSLWCMSSILPSVNGGLVD